jgi:hypothetical protein
MGQRAIIVKAFKTVAKIPVMRNRWLTCESWASAINTRTPIGINIDVDGVTLSSSLARDEELSTYTERYEYGVNMTGFFKLTFKNIKFYYDFDAGEGILRPTLHQEWYDNVMNNQSTVAMSVRSFSVSGQESVDNDAVPRQQSQQNRRSNRIDGVISAAKRNHKLYWLYFGNRLNLT